MGDRFGYSLVILKTCRDLRRRLATCWGMAWHRGMMRLCGVMQICGMTRNCAAMQSCGVIHYCWTNRRWMNRSWTTTLSPTIDDDRQVWSQPSPRCWSD